MVVRTLAMVMDASKRVEQPNAVSVLPDEIFEAIFSHLTALEKARVAGVCRLFRDIAYRPRLWRSLDTWGLGWDRKVAATISSRCTDLEELTARGAVAALSCIHLKARKLRKLHLDSCADLMDAALGVLIGRHEGLTSVHLDGAAFLTNESIEVIALACPLLESLRVGGFKDCVDKEALTVLFEGCPKLAELSLTDCQMVDEGGLAAATQLQLLSLAGCKVSSWAIAAEVLHKLPNLVGIDVSRTEIWTTNASYLLFNSQSLSILIALDCRCVNDAFISSRLLSLCPRKLAVFILDGDLTRSLACVRSPPNGVAQAAAEVPPQNSPTKPGAKLPAETIPLRSTQTPHLLPMVQTRAQALVTSIADLPSLVSPSSSPLKCTEPGPPVGKSVWEAEEGNDDAVLTSAQRRAADWVECALVHGLQRAAEKKAELERFWLQNGTRALVALLQSEQASVQEKAAVTLADLAIDEADTVTAHVDRSTSIYKEGAIGPLLRLARRPVDSLQGEAMKALGNLCVNKHAAELVVQSGGIGAFLRAANSANKWVAEEAAGALWNLSMNDSLKDRIAAAGVLDALVGLLSRWPKDAEVVQERVAGALANMANHEATSFSMVNGPCLGVLNRLLRTSSHEGLQEQIVRVLANLAAQGDCNTSNNVAIARTPFCLSALVALTKDGPPMLQIEAATALWNLAFDEGVRELIAAEGGVHSLVGLAKQCCGGEFFALQERVTGALWGLSASQGNSVLIGEEGGIPPLIQMARSASEDVQEAAAGVLWNLAFDTRNARIIKAEGGIPALTALSVSPQSTLLAKFMAVLALSYLCDSQAEKDRHYVLRPSDDRKEVFQRISAFVDEHSQHYVSEVPHLETLPRAPPAPKGRRWEVLPGKGPSVLTWQVTSEASTMREVGDLRCSDFEIERFTLMLRDPYETLQHCAAFALLQFTMPGGRHTPHHVAAMRKAGGTEVLSAILSNSAGASKKLRCLVELIVCNIEESGGHTNHKD